MRRRYKSFLFFYVNALCWYKIILYLCPIKSLNALNIMGKSTFIHGAKKFSFSKYTMIVLVTKLLDDFEDVDQVWLKEDAGDDFFVVDEKGVTLFKINKETDQITQLSK